MSHAQDSTFSLHTQENNTAPVGCLERGLSPPRQSQALPLYYTQLASLPAWPWREPLEFAPLVVLTALSLPSISLGNLPAFSALVFLKQKKSQTQTQTQRKHKFLASKGAIHSMSVDQKT